MMQKHPKDFFSQCLSAQNIITDDNDIQPYLTEWRGRFEGHTKLVLLPETTEQVSQIIKISNENNLSIIPQGGNTGLVGGQIPDNSGQEIILSLNKMNKIR